MVTTVFYFCHSPLEFTLQQQKRHSNICHLCIFVNIPSFLTSLLFQNNQVFMLFAFLATQAICETLENQRTGGNRSIFLPWLLLYQTMVWQCIHFSTEIIFAVRAMEPWLHVLLYFGHCFLLCSLQAQAFLYCRMTHRSLHIFFNTAFQFTNVPFTRISLIPYWAYYLCRPVSTGSLWLKNASQCFNHKESSCDQLLSILWDSS